MYYKVFNIKHSDFNCHPFRRKKRKLTIPEKRVILKMYSIFIDKSMKPSRARKKIVDFTGTYQMNQSSRRGKLLWHHKHTIVFTNLAIFLPLWFYVKSVLTDFRRSKPVVLTVFEALNFDFWKKFTLINFQMSENLKFRAAQMVKFTDFGASKWPKLISLKIWVAEKSCNFHIVYSQLGCPGL